MKIHLGWVGSAPPPHVLAAVNAVRSVARGCEVMFHTDEAAVPIHWRRVSKTLRPQMRSDVQRHAVLREYGGLWLDADVRVLKNPAEWTAGWDRYTAVRLGDGLSFIGTDIIYIPTGWEGWGLIDAHIEQVLASIATTRRVSMLALASRMIESCRRQRPELFSILDPGGVFPARADMLTSASVVARNFDPAGVPGRATEPGLGDMIANGLAAVGITKERVQRVANAVGIKDCGCGKRQAAANRLGTLVGLPPGSTAES